MTTMQRIETEWRGYRFRSRLEARWAVFFDRLGVRWEYEPEGFELGGAGRYLPDFRVTTVGGRVVRWYEIRRLISPCSDPKVNALNERLGCTSGDVGGDYAEALLLRGDPRDRLEAGDMLCPRCGGFLPRTDVYVFSGPTHYNCWPCAVTTPSGGYQPSEPGVMIPVAPHKGVILAQRAEVDRWHAHSEAAADTARAARFEFGEAPE